MLKRCQRPLIKWKVSLKCFYWLWLESWLVPLPSITFFFVHMKEKGDGCDSANSHTVRDEAVGVRVNTAIHPPWLGWLLCCLRSTSCTAVPALMVEQTYTGIYASTGQYQYFTKSRTLCMGAGLLSKPDKTQILPKQPVYSHWLLLCLLLKTGLLVHILSSSFFFFNIADLGKARFIHRLVSGVCVRILSSLKRYIFASVVIILTAENKTLLIFTTCIA